MPSVRDYKPNQAISKMNEQFQGHPSFDPALNRQEAAAYLDMHPETLGKLARERRIGYIKAPGLRGTIKFKLSHLNAWLRQHETKPARQTA